MEPLNDGETARTTLDMRRKRLRGGLAVVIACGTLMLYHLPTCKAAAEPPDADRENQLRAGYLINFVKFVEWPTAPTTDALTICFVGGTGIKDSLSARAGGKAIGTRPFITRMLADRASVEGCQVLYVEAAAPFAKAYAGGEVKPSLLTIGDAHDFTNNGGIVELYSDSNRLRFNVNLNNARRAGLRLSSSLLQLASHVEGQ